MAIIDNLTHETSVTTGTGAFTLTNVNGKQPFNTSFGTGGTDLFYYFISNRSAAEYEWGTGHLSSASVLVRDTVIGGSNTTSLVNFSSGTKDVTCAVEASHTVNNLGTDLAFSLADAGADAIFGWDDSVAQYENLTGAEAFAVIQASADAVYQPKDADLTSWAGVTRDVNFDAFVATPSSANFAQLVTGETGTGNCVFQTSPGFATAANPVSNDGATLGTLTGPLLWSDLFLAEGAVINWDSGDLTLTQTGNDLRLEGGGAVVNHTARLSTFWATQTPNFQIVNLSTASGLGLATFGTDATSHHPCIEFARSRGSSVASYTVVNSGDILGVLRFSGSDGTDFSRGAEIVVTATTGVGSANEMPAKMEFKTAADGSETPTTRMTIYQTGQVVIGNAGTGVLMTNAYSNDPGTELFQVLGDYFSGTISVGAWSAADDGPAELVLGSCTRNATIGTFTVVQSGDSLGSIGFSGSDGTNFEAAARITAKVDTTPGANDMPGRLEFYTTPDGAAIPELKLSICSDGGLKFPGTQLASTNVNTLDDYEEGTWTPALTTDGSPMTITTDGSVGGWYTKIGQAVACTGFYRNDAATGGSGGIYLTLPFTAGATQHYTTFNFASAGAGGGGWGVLVEVGGVISSQASLQPCTNTIDAPLTVSNVQNGTDKNWCHFSGTYRAST